jgi:sugar lactone lactonase YvrE
VLTTVAGDGSPGFFGDGGPATKAKLDQPEAVAFDRDGNIYVSDSANNRVRKIDTDGVITTIAGTGKTGAAGDGGPAINAQITDPYGLAFDSKGNLYVSDTDNNRVRRIDTHGAITTVAGTGTAGFSGDGGPATKAELNGLYGLVIDKHGNLYIADNGSQRVRKIDAHGVITTLSGG